MVVDLLFTLVDGKPVDSVVEALACYDMMKHGYYFIDTIHLRQI
jgi:hypothetical protein